VSSFFVLRVNDFVVVVAFVEVCFVRRVTFFGLFLLADWALFVFERHLWFTSRCAFGCGCLCRGESHSNGFQAFDCATGNTAARKRMLDALWLARAIPFRVMMMRWMDADHR